MPAQHRRRKAYVKLGATFAGLLLVGGTVGGVASAHQSRSTSTGVTTGTTVARTNAVNGAQERATFRITDTGNSIVISGTARNMRPEVSYESLIYPDSGCSKTETPTTLTLAGVWQGHGSSTQYLYAVYSGKAYQDVRGKIGSESIRRVDFAANAPGSSTNTPLACAPVSPTR